MRYCLDSNVIIDVFRGDKNLGVKLEKYQTSYCITPVILCELYKGAFMAGQSEKALFLINAFEQSAELLPFNAKACRLFGKLYSELRKKGKQTSEADLMIACVAMVHDAKLITRNEKNFKNIPGLKLIAV